MACCCTGGACCESNGTCSVKPQLQCQGAGQTFRGVGTVCTPTPCCPCGFSGTAFQNLPTSLSISISLGGFISASPNNVGRIRQESWKSAVNSSYTLPFTDTLFVSGADRARYGFGNTSFTSGVVWYCQGRPISQFDCFNQFIGGPQGGKMCVISNGTVVSPPDNIVVWQGPGQYQSYANRPDIVDTVNAFGSFLFGAIDPFPTVPTVQQFCLTKSFGSHTASGTVAAFVNIRVTDSGGVQLDRFTRQEFWSASATISASLNPLP